MVPTRAFSKDRLKRINVELRKKFGKQLELWRNSAFEMGNRGYPFYDAVAPYLEKYAVKKGDRVSPDRWVQSHITQIKFGRITTCIGAYLEWALDNVGSDAEQARKMLGLEYEAAYLEEKKNANPVGEPVGRPHAITSDARALTPTPHQEISAPLSVHEFAAYRKRTWEEIGLLHEDYEVHQIEEIIVEELVATNGGYWLLTAGPGMGKSALMSSLAKRFAVSGTCIPYVFRQERGSERENRAEGFHAYLLSYLAYQFNEPVPAAADREEALRKLLFALGAKGGVRSDAPIVIVVDGLDEMYARIYGADNQENPLELPSLLPPGVHVVCSLRLESEHKVPHGVLPFGYRRVDVHGRSNFQAHKLTVLRYVTRVCQKNGFIAPYHVGSLSEDKEKQREYFVRSMSESADYNFGILKFVLNDQVHWEDGGIHMGLTGNLGDFFEKYIDRMLSHETYSVRAKATFLFALKGHITQYVLFSVLAKLEGINAQKVIEDWIKQGLIAQYSLENTLWCRVFHSTYQDFLIEKLELIDSSFLLEDIINVVTDIVWDNEWMRNTLPVHGGNFIVLLIKLCLVSGKLVLLNDLLSRLYIWEIASKSPDGVTSILICIARISYAGHTKQDVLNLHKNVAANLAIWIREGTLQGHRGEFSGLADVIRITDNAAVTRNRRNSSSLSWYIGEFICIE